MFMDSFFMGGGFSIMFTLVFVLVIGTFIVTIVRGIGEWGKNNASPRLTVKAVVVAKRTKVGHHHHNNGTAMSHSSSYTNYYVTFEVESGDRIELNVNGNEYGMLAEGDQGELSFQGTRYLGFSRTPTRYR